MRKARSEPTIKTSPPADGANATGTAMKQFVLTSSMGKRLIGKAVARHPAVTAALKNDTVVIVAGTTNGYVAEEVLSMIGQSEGFTRKGFRRGVTVPPGAKAPDGELTGDVVIVGGAWQRGKQIFDVVADLSAGDVIIKGANAVNLRRREAGVYIGHPEGGTAAAAIPAVVGRRVRLIVPVGLEKRVDSEIAALAAELNAPGVEGPRMLPLPGEVFTELDAVALLTGAEGHLLAGGGIAGAEGCVWIGVKGTADQLAAATALLQGLAGEPPCAG